MILALRDATRPAKVVFSCPGLWPCSCISVVMFERTGLDLGNFLTHLVRRQEVIASNIANADTPGFRARDVAAPGSFQELMQGSLGTVMESSDLAQRNDGNNVSIDREARLLAENTLRFNLVTQMLRSQFKGIRSAIDEGKTS